MQNPKAAKVVCTIGSNGDVGLGAALRQRSARILNCEHYSRPYCAPADGCSQPEADPYLATFQPNQHTQVGLEDDFRCKYSQGLLCAKIWCSIIVAGVD